MTTNEMIAKAKSLLGQNDYGQAQAIFEQVYSKQQTFDLNIWLVSSLMPQEKYALALDYMQDFETDYLKSDHLADWYINLLLHNQYFVEAGILIQQQTFSDKTREKLCLQQAIVEKQYLKTHADTIKVAKNAALYLNQFDLMEQTELTFKLRQLPISEFQEAIVPVLQSPLLAPIVKSSLLEDLVKLKIDQQVTYNWFNQPKMLIPKDLPFINQQPAIVKLQQLIAEKLTNDEPDVLTMHQQTTALFAASIYPYAQTVIQTPSLWCQAIIENDSQCLPESEAFWWQQLQSLTSISF